VINIQTTRVKLKKPGIMVLAGTFLVPFMQGTLLFISAGRINIFRAWCYLVISFIGMFGGIAVVSKFDPELVNQRGLCKKKRTLNNGIKSFFGYMFLLDFGFRLL
jgi:hypothetical protein